MMTVQEGGRTVVRALEELRVHPALEEIGFCAFLPELNEATRSQDQMSPEEPICVTHTGLILSGFGCWRSAVFDGRFEINCIEYPLSDVASLKFILTHHQTRRGWSDFVRIRLALTLEPALQQKALDNMRTGGKLKGLANLPEAHRINVREEIARAAGVGDRNVTNVRTILQGAHPSLIQALQEGVLSINRAIQLCNLPKAGQLEQFIRYTEERAINKVIRRSIPQPNEKKASLDVVSVLDALQQQEAREPGSVKVRVGRQKRTVILIGEDLSAGLAGQLELR
jgi:hypothetical protein